MNKSTQEQYMQRAWDAVNRAATLGGHAESAAYSNNNQHKAGPLAEAGALWADVARTYLTIAAALPDPLPELPTTGTEF